MFDGIKKRIVCMWFPRLASDRVLRLRPVEGPFALTLRSGDTQRLYCLNEAAEKRGLQRAMRFADARAFCPDLVSQPARPDLDAQFLAGLRRWATRYCPWVWRDGEDGLLLDVTGATHLWRHEEEMLANMRSRSRRAGLTVSLGLAETHGAAWALAHFGQKGAALSQLPVAALRLDEGTVTSLQRLGLRTIADLSGMPRAALSRRFGPALLKALDQATGAVNEPVFHEMEPPTYAVRMSLPDPIGLTSDVMGITERLLVSLCGKLKQHEAGARKLCLTLRRVDQDDQKAELHLAAPMRDPQRLKALFEHSINKVEAGYGIDQMRLVATLVEPLDVQQIGTSKPAPDKISDLITRIGTRIGLENVKRLLPADTHVPERAFSCAPAAVSQPAAQWPVQRPRPLLLFKPEPISASGSKPPERFKWRRMRFTTARLTGPERIAPEWWTPDDNWNRGIRDYWKVETREGRRLWIFHTPQKPGWFVQGEFP